MKHRQNIAVSVFLALSLSSAHGARLHADYDHNPNFAYIRTFSFGDILFKDPSYSVRIKQLITEALLARGWDLLPSGGEVTIYAHDDVRSEYQAEKFYSAGPWGDGWVWTHWKLGPGGGLSNGVSSGNGNKGQLAVDVFSRESRQLIRRGTSRLDLSQLDRKTTDRLNKDVRTLTSRFPARH